MRESACQCLPPVPAYHLPPCHARPQLAKVPHTRSRNAFVHSSWLSPPSSLLHSLVGLHPHHVLCPPPISYEPHIHGHLTSLITAANFTPPLFSLSPPPPSIVFVVFQMKVAIFNIFQGMVRSLPQPPCAPSVCI